MRYSFLRSFSMWQRGIFSTKQMMVYDQIKFFTDCLIFFDFFDEQKNLDKINCYSNEGIGWDKTKLELVDKKLNIFFREKFKERRGRINCSMNDIEGWRWVGIQFSIN